MYWTVWLIQINSVLRIILWIPIWFLIEKPRYFLFFFSIPILQSELFLLFLYLIHPLHPLFRLPSNKLEQILILKNLPVLHHSLCLEQPLQKVSFFMQKVGDWLLRILLYPMWLLKAFGDLEPKLALQYLFLLADLVDDECLVVQLYHVETPLVFVIGDRKSLGLFLQVFDSF